MVGSGIFRVPTTVASLIDTPAAILSVWLFGGVLSLCLALLLAEMGALFPHAGGMYVFLREAYGEGVAFVYGWTFLLVNPAAWATLATAAAEYLGYFHALSDGQRRLLAIGLILALSAANCWSVQLGAFLQSATTSAKVIALAGLTGLIVVVGSGGHGGFAQPATATRASGAAWLLALVAVIWAYEGASGFCALAGEVRNPQRAVPRALIAGVGTVTALFVAVNVALLYVLPVPAIAGTPLALTLATGSVLGAAGAAVVSGLVVVATLGSLAGCVLSDPRVFFAMARDRNFFAGIGVVLPGRRTPAFAIVLHAVLASLYVAARNFEQLAATFVLGFVPFSALVAVAVWRLRRTRPDLARPFRAPGVPLLAGFWVVLAGLLIGNALIETPAVAIINLLITLGGVPVFFLWRRVRGRKQLWRGAG